MTEYFRVAKFSPFCLQHEYFSQILLFCGRQCPQKLRYRSNLRGLTGLAPFLYWFRDASLVKQDGGLQLLQTGTNRNSTWRNLEQYLLQRHFYIFKQNKKKKKKKKIGKIKKCGNAPIQRRFHMIKNCGTIYITTVSRKNCRSTEKKMGHELRCGAGVLGRVGV